VAGSPVPRRLLVATLLALAVAGVFWPILGHAWQNGEDLDLASLITHIQQPPVKRVGVMEIESFLPSKERFALAMRMNNLLETRRLHLQLDTQVAAYADAVRERTSELREAQTLLQKG